jgi:hypothetical protein
MLFVNATGSLSRGVNWSPSRKRSTRVETHLCRRGTADITNVEDKQAKIKRVGRG